MNENEIKLEEVIICQYDDGSKDYRIDTIWYMLNNLKSPFGDLRLFNPFSFTVSNGQIDFNNAAFKRQN